MKWKCMCLFSLMPLCHFVSFQKDNQIKPAVSCSSNAKLISSLLFSLSLSPLCIVFSINAMCNAEATAYLFPCCCSPFSHFYTFKRVGLFSCGRKWHCSKLLYREYHLYSYFFKPIQTEFLTAILCIIETVKEQSSTQKRLWHILHHILCYNSIRVNMQSVKILNSSGYVVSDWKKNRQTFEISISSQKNMLLIIVNNNLLIWLFVVFAPNSGWVSTNSKTFSLHTETLSKHHFTFQFFPFHVSPSSISI